MTITSVYYTGLYMTTHVSKFHTYRIFQSSTLDRLLKAVHKQDALLSSYMFRCGYIRILRLTQAVNRVVPAKN